MIDSLGDFAGVMATPLRRDPEIDVPEDSAKVASFLIGADTTTRETIGLDQRKQIGEGSSAGIFDRNVSSFRHCRFPCDIPWHSH